MILLLAKCMIILALTENGFQASQDSTLVLTVLNQFAKPARGISLGLMGHLHAQCGERPTASGLYATFAQEIQTRSPLPSRGTFIDTE
ncbi:hypothetical protein N7519_009205 [Penicillium mononematosum]|uniref:uncharacterized protein n=1 Tax=Penicillium mononematosum TaxID=268346 RepID=UPI002549ACD6|nr:uncharacterized protein N7519_009205 [Penicillium mononematosum]KAJ6178744.1 hypothetical protein N7519_009205 [Penicillium mononematosum]